MKWVIDHLKNYPQIAVEVIDLKTWNLPLFAYPLPPMMGEYSSDLTKQWSKAIRAADGYIFVTPEYNHSFPAALKNALDYLHYEWNYKPVAFVSYGASSGGIRAVEQLRQVVSELKMVGVREDINIAFPSKSFDQYGKLADHVETKMSTMISELIWWANTLKTARIEKSVKKHASKILAKA